MNATDVADVPPELVTALHHSYGVILIAGLVALFLSGAVFAQAVLYFRLYPTDTTKKKTLVLTILALDVAHSSLICTANWHNLMEHFGNFENLSEINWSLTATVPLTSMSTFMTHCFFTHRIHSLSGGNWYITTPLFVLALARIISGLATTGEMVRIPTFIGMLEHFKYLVTLGLAIATCMDVLVTVLMCYFLHRRRSGLARMDRVVNGLILYTVETGMLTSITTVTSVICWVSLANNLVFMGLHLCIAKLYANSLLASLNTRKSIQKQMDGTIGTEGFPMPVMFPTRGDTSRSSRFASRLFGRSTMSMMSTSKPVHVNIDVQSTVLKSEGGIHTQQHHLQTVSEQTGTQVETEGSIGEAEMKFQQCA